MHVIEKVVVNNFEHPRKSVCENQNVPIKFSKNATHEIELNAGENFHFFLPLNLKEGRFIFFNIFVKLIFMPVKNENEKKKKKTACNKSNNMISRNRIKILKPSR